MKNKLFIKMGVLATISAPVFLVLSCGTKKNELEEKSKVRQEIKQDILQTKLEPSKFNYRNEETDLIKNIQSADINLFFNSWGAITHTYMMRLALIANTEIHYGFTKNASGLAYEDSVNTKQLEGFLKTRITDWDEDTKQIFPNSEAFTVGSDIEGESVIKKWLEVIKQNPSKKINVFWNSDHLDHLNGGGTTTPLDLLKFSNVNLILLEDGASISLTKNISKASVVKAHLAKPSDNLKNIDQYALPDIFNGRIKSYFSSKTGVERFKTLGIKNIYQMDPQILFEKIFNTRDEEGKRLMSEWPKATGLDWHLEKKTLDEASKNGKESMIILGSYGVDEAPFLEQIYKKYSNKYNLFYKGHPGHFRWNNFVKTHYNGKIYLLDPMISSEELTKEHVNEGMFFNKVVCVGETSAIVGGFSNGKNDITKDLLEMYLQGKLISNVPNPGQKSELEKTLPVDFWNSIVAGK